MRALLAALTLALVSCGTGVLAHDVQGHKMPGVAGGEYLWGHRIGTPLESGKVNCCLLYGVGDCAEVKASEVERVDGGFVMPDGEFIAEADATLSPDGKLYRCRHAGAPSHCLFITVPRG